MAWPGGSKQTHQEDFTLRLIVKIRLSASLSVFLIVSQEEILKYRKADKLIRKSSTRILTSNR